MTTESDFAFLERGEKKRKLFVRTDLPATKTNRINCVVVFSHGLHEHSSRFAETFSLWASAKYNIASVSFDHIGHGKSDNYCKINHQIESFEKCVEDFRAVVEYAQMRFGRKVPVALAGVSLGGLFALRCAMTYPKNYFLAIVLIAPAINVKWTAQKKALAMVGEVIAKATPNMKVVPATTMQSLTEDAATAREFEEDPFNYVGKARARFGNEILKAMKAVEKASESGRLDGITRNILAVHAEKDAATCAQSTERLFSRSLKSIPNKQFVKLTHTKGHLLLHEPGCEWTRALIGRFLVEAVLEMKNSNSSSSSLASASESSSLMKTNDVLFSPLSSSSTIRTSNSHNRSKTVEKEEDDREEERERKFLLPPKSRL
jgi:alpha-beta hydrolase superfamily lysophospholipase